MRKNAPQINGIPPRSIIPKFVLAASLHKSLKSVYIIIWPMVDIRVHYNTNNNDNDDDDDDDYDDDDDDDDDYYYYYYYYYYY